MKKVMVMMVALMATVSVCAQRRYDTETLNRAEKLMNEGKHNESLMYFEAELKEHPKNPYAYFLMTTVYMEMNQYDRAMSAVDRALMYMPKRHKEIRGIAHALKATIHSHFKEWEEAVEQLSLCLSVLPNDATEHRALAHKQRAEIYYKLGSYDLGDKDYVKYEELKKKVETNHETVEADTAETGDTTNKPLNDIRFAGWTEKEWLDNEYIRTLRRYLNDYSQGKIEYEELELYRHLTKGQFVVGQIEPFILGGVFMYIMFVDDPEKVFTVCVYSEVDVQAEKVLNYEVRSIEYQSEVPGMPKELLQQIMKEHPEQKVW